MNTGTRLLALMLLLAGAGCGNTGAGIAAAPAASADDLKVQALSFQASDGVLLHAWLGGQAASMRGR